MIKLGIDLIDKYLNLFIGKKVGLITNPTGVNSKLVSTIDILNEKTDLIALFSPEHGVRGNIQAGVRISDYIDEKTGINVYSLYGKNRSPSKEIMEKIDILVFDIQDVGARFYTYIYTMAYAMMACAENNKPMVVFDRPNPVNAEDVEGNILNIEYRSFVGYYPIPQRYGLTIGELAELFNKEFKINANLTVVKMESYNRQMKYGETGLHWIMPSPNIPYPTTAFPYLATCIFEGTNLSEGRGTTKPFNIIGSPYLDSEWVIKEIEKYKLDGVIFRTLFFNPSFSKFKGELCNGIELIITDESKFKPVKTGYILLDLIRKHHKDFDYIPPFKKGSHHFIDFITGDSYIRKGILSIEDILKIIEKDTLAFRKIKRRYHLYG